MEPDKNIEALLRQEMSADKLNTEVPDILAMSEARKIILARKKTDLKKKGSFLSALLNFFNFRIRLYQGGFATRRGAIMVFGIVNENNMSNEKITETSAEPDSLECSSLKANIFLVRNFSSRVN